MKKSFHSILTLMLFSTFLKNAKAYSIDYFIKDDVLTLGEFDLDVYVKMITEVWDYFPTSARLIVNKLYSSVSTSNFFNALSMGIVHIYASKYFKLNSAHEDIALGHGFQEELIPWNFKPVAVRYSLGYNQDIIGFSGSSLCSNRNINRRYWSLIERSRAFRRNFAEQLSNHDIANINYPKYNKL